jgi:hypothetical protein
VQRPLFNAVNPYISEAVECSCIQDFGVCEHIEVEKGLMETEPTAQHCPNCGAMILEDQPGFCEACMEVI